MSRFVISFGRVDGTATKNLYPNDRTFALDIADSLSFVLFKKHHFKRSECRDGKRVEEGEFFVEFIDNRRRTQHGLHPSSSTQCS